MARIGMLKPRLSTVDTRTVRPMAKVADPYYGTAEHKAWAGDVKQRAGGVCQDPEHKGERLVCKGIADHIEERRDRPDLQLDPGNGMYRCWSCHARKTYMARQARMERGDDVPAANHPEWLLPSVVPLTIVCGPPASGKTTWARQQLAGRGLLIDLDEIMAKLSGLALYEAGREWLNPAVRQRNALLGALSKQPKFPRAGLIVSEPTAERREWWARKLRPTRIVVIETPEAICMQRLEGDPRRDRRRAEVTEAVKAWWRSYTRRPGDVIVGPPEAWR
ncbi:MAG: HNH endonuclease [Rhodospirillaceae bacterium]|nr:MAG: HNH endonuclease [Rhodospirillaceae bacterium]